MELGIGAMYIINTLILDLQIKDIILMIEFGDSLMFNMICVLFLLKPLCLISLKNNKRGITFTNGSKLVVKTPSSH